MITTESIGGIAERVLTTFMGWEMQIVESVELDPTNMTIAGSVQIDGPWSGAVVLNCSEPVARHAAAQIGSVDPVTEHHHTVDDAVSELANMIAGNLKASLSETSSLSLPTIATGSNLCVRIADSITIDQAVLQCPKGLLTVTLLERRAVVDV